MRRDKFTRELERAMNVAAAPFLAELEEKRERARQKARAEVNRRLRNRDAIPEQRPVKPLAGQLSLFDECGKRRKVVSTGKLKRLFSQHTFQQFNRPARRLSSPIQF